VSAAAVVIFSLSIAAQVAAAALALCLIRITRYRIGWLLASCALLLMALRRVVAFAAGLRTDQMIHVTASEIIGLLISIVFVIAMVLMRSYFLRMAEYDHAVRELERRRDAILDAIAFAAQHFLRVPAWESVIGDVQARLGIAADVSRVYVFQNHLAPDGALHMRQCAEWCAPGIMPDIHDDEFQDMPWHVATLPAWPAALSGGHLVTVHVAALPEPLHSFFAASQIKSMLLVPIFVHNQWWGFIGFDECRAQRIWSQAETDALQTAAAVLGSAIAHARDAGLLADREVHYRTLFDFSPSGILLETATGTIVDVNHAFCTFFGYARAELIGKDVRMLVTPDKRAMVDTNLARLLAGERLYSVVSNLRKDGALVHMELRETCLTLPDGTRFILVVANDVSEHVRITEALRESEERFRLIFETCSLGIATMELESQRITQANPAFCRMLGYSAAELCQLTLRAITHPDDMDDELRAAKPLRQNSAAFFNVRKRYRRRDGSTFWAHVTASIARDAAGAPLYGIGIAEDITAHLAHEQELLRAQKLESLGVLAGGIAHDFNNILTVILGNASLARQLPAPDAECVPLLADIEQAAVRARGLTQQLLTFAKGGAPVKQRASLREILTESSLFVARGSSVACAFEIDEHLAPVEVDTAQISQVFQNLVINAVQAMPTGGTVTVRAENVALDDPQILPPGTYVRITIADTGMGIPEAHLTRIFDPYFTTKQVGSGLGLTTALSIVMRHGGRLEVQSHIGHGTACIVHLPALTSDHSIDVHVPAALTTPVVSATRGHVLVMDDELPVRTLLVRTLQESGYTVAAAANGDEALALFRAAHAHPPRFDVVILDLTVRGGMGGADVLTHLRQIDPGIKAIVSSGYSSDPIMADFRAAGFNGAVPKPFRIEDLATVLQRVMACPAVADTPHTE